MEVLLAIVLPAIASFILTYYITNNFILKKRRVEILKSAEQEGENIKKEKIFQAKEKFLQLKET
jgi:ribonuclease Y